MRVLNREQMQTADRVTINAVGIPAHALMERAGRQAARIVRERWPADTAGRRVSIFAGLGNNGGDGFVLARVLEEAGSAVHVYLLGRRDQVIGDARRHFDAMSPHVYVATIASAADWQHHRLDARNTDLIVDALFGTGLSRRLEGLPATIVGDINACGVPVVALDIPSGLSADRTDIPGPAIQADLTIAFAAPKLPLVVTPACALAGELVIADIGIPREVVTGLAGPFVEWLERPSLRAIVPRRPMDSHKGLYGHIVVVGGSVGKVGAPALTARAALRSGAGLVTVATPAACWPSVASFAPELMTEPLAQSTDGGIAESAVAKLGEREGTVLAVGPGLGTAGSTVLAVRALVASTTRPLVLDADALNALADRPALLQSRRTSQVVITPHPGEMARLVGKPTSAVQADRLTIARDFARAHDVFVVLKGHRTVIASPKGAIWINSTGNPGMATGGMGDVLTGVIAAWLGAGLSADKAAALGVFLHGLAGDAAAISGAVGITATDVIERLPHVLQALTSPDPILE
jgi:NAD(P)H-hydrate epimerase